MDTFQEDVACLDELDEKDWAEIRSIAKQMLRSKQHGSDQFKITCHAFLLWIIENGQMAIMEVQDQQTPDVLH